MKGLLAGLAASALWGAVFVVSKAVLPVVPPFTLLSLRLILASLVLAAVLLIRRRPAPRSGGKSWAAVAAAGALGYGLSLGLQFVGTDLGTASNAALLTCATPVFAVLFAGPVLGQKTGRRQWAALALAAAGVVAVAGAGWGASWADGLLVSAAALWALFTVVTARVARGWDLTWATLAGFLGGLPFTLAGSGFELAAGRLGAVTPEVAAGVVFLGVAATAVAMALWNYAFRVLPAATASLTFFAQPVTGTALAVLFLGEAPGMLFWGGAALITAALILGRPR